ncbi:Nitrile hydratase beta subunit [Tistlia consotensis]|uniref:Nitrile hydratase beta subunit n=1 Tax=Tistlia consotensis USBA 355 TaxID=560819 RepID=A0A1Y6CM14_9PROT|nr:Nitrile hydratase beta subunit [Tistlia consotensis USBA 355]SNS09886.1 Nitrile hydratase beta subunit [Tistlia consotensis]
MSENTQDALPCWGPHDVGGRAAGPVDRSEHDTAQWEWQIDAMVRLLLQKGVLSDFAELRDGIEKLTPEDYERLGYYERWAAAVAYALIDKGVIAEDELRATVESLKEGRSAAGGAGAA